MSLMDVFKNLKGDVTKSLEKLADVAYEDNKALRHLSKLFLGDDRLQKLQRIKLTEAQENADMKAIEAGQKKYEDGHVLDVPMNGRMIDWQQFVSVKNQIEDARRLLLAVQETAEKIKAMPEKDFSDEQASSTFYNRWRKEVEVIDDEKLRDLWSSILAEEIARPKSVSLRTLDVVRNLSFEDAQIFQRMIQGQVEDCIPHADASGDVQFGTYAEAIRMQDAGLVHSAFLVSSTITRQFSMPSGDKGVGVLLENSDYMLCVFEKEIRISCYPLTIAGRELSRLALRRRDFRDVVAIAEYIKKGHKNVKMSLHRKRLNGDDYEVIPAWTTEKSSEAAKK